MVVMKIRIYKDENGALRLAWENGLNAVSQNSVESHVIQFIPDGFELAHGEHIRIAFATSLNESDVNTESVGWTSVPLDWIENAYKIAVPPLVLATRGAWYVQAQIVHGIVYANQFDSICNSVNALSFIVNNTIYDASGNYPSSADITALYQQTLDMRAELNGEIMTATFAVTDFLSVKGLIGLNTVDWGDGAVENINGANGAAHYYDEAGTYTCKFYGVTEIAEDAFNHSDQILKVYIPDKVTKMGANAFNECVNLQKLQMGNGLTEIPYRAFMYCGKLEEATIGNGVKIVGAFAFSNTALKNVVLPASVIQIGEWAFAQSKHLTSVIIGNSVSIIEAGAFLSCSALASLVFGCSVTKIGEEVFSGCNLLTSVDLPSSINEIGQNAFANTGLKRIVLPAGITTIAEYTFFSCNNLEEVIIPNSVTSIGDSAFRDCNIARLELPSSVTSIGARFLYYNDVSGTILRELKINAVEPPTLGENIFRVISSTKIVVPFDSLDKYKAAEGWKNYANYIKGNALVSGGVATEEYVAEKLSETVETTVPFRCDNVTVAGEVVEGAEYVVLYHNFVGSANRTPIIGDCFLTAAMDISTFQTVYAYCKVKEVQAAGDILVEILRVLPSKGVSEEYIDEKIAQSKIKIVRSF